MSRASNGHTKPVRRGTEKRSHLPRERPSPSPSGAITSKAGKDISKKSPRIHTKVGLMTSHKTQEMVQVEVLIGDLRVPKIAHPTPRTLLKIATRILMAIIKRPEDATSAGRLDI
jgi:hypothetical protein